MMDPDDPRHGTTNGYRKGCRDACCRAAAAAARAAERKRRYLLRTDYLSVPPLGTHRRIQALVALGWSLAEISRRAGYDRSHVPLILTRHGPLQARTVERIAKVYDTLSMQLPEEKTGPQRHAASKARNLARRNGWPPPLAWDDIDNDPAPATAGYGPDIDPVVVLRVLNGSKVAATNQERREVVRRWAATGRSLNELARLTGWKPERYGVSA